MKIFGTTTVRQFRIYRIDMPDLTSVENLLATTIRPDMSDREKAEALYEVVRKYRYHDAPPIPDGEVWDPIKLMEVYGYGLCGDAAAALAFLWRKTGLPSRVWELSGHVVPEVFYYGKWHMYDPDHGKFYLNDRGEVADVEYLAEHPDIVVKKTWPEVGEIFATKHNNWINTRKSVKEAYRINLIIYPGEKFIRFRQGEKRHFRSANYLKRVSTPPTPFSTMSFLF